MFRPKKRSEIDWQPAPDITKAIKHLVQVLHLEHINSEHIFCYRSTGSSSRARARIWALPRIWQLALKIKPYYVIEVLAEKFDHLSKDDRTRILIHELMHIPKTFSGSLAPHRGRFHTINHKTVEQLFQKYINDDR